MVLFSSKNTLIKFNVTSPNEILTFFWPDLQNPTQFHSLLSGKAAPLLAPPHTNRFNFQFPRI